MYLFLLTLWASLRILLTAAQSRKSFPQVGDLSALLSLPGSCRPRRVPPRQNYNSRQRLFSCASVLAHGPSGGGRVAGGGAGSMGAGSRGEGGGEGKGGGLWSPGPIHCRGRPGWGLVCYELWKR